MLRERGRCRAQSHGIMPRGGRKFIWVRSPCHGGSLGSRLVPLMGKIKLTQCKVLRASWGRFISTRSGARALALGLDHRAPPPCSSAPARTCSTPTRRSDTRSGARALALGLDHRAPPSCSSPPARTAARQRDEATHAAARARWPSALITVRRRAAGSSAPARTCSTPTRRSDTRSGARALALGLDHRAPPPCCWLLGPRAYLQHANTTKRHTQRRARAGPRP